MIDGWSNEGTHYIAIFHAQPSGNCGRYAGTFSVFSTLDNATYQSVEQHVLLITYVLTLYSKLSLNDGAIIADNYAENKSVAPLVGFQFMNGPSHQFKLSMNTIIGQHPKIRCHHASISN